MDLSIVLSICNYISSLKYEGDSSNGKLLICKEDHPNIHIRIRLTKPIQLQNRRKVRKLLELQSTIEERKVPKVLFPG